MLVLIPTLLLPLFVSLSHPWISCMILQILAHETDSSRNRSSRGSIFLIPHNRKKKTSDLDAQGHEKSTRSFHGKKKKELVMGKSSPHAWTSMELPAAAGWLTSSSQEHDKAHWSFQPSKFLMYRSRWILQPTELLGFSCPDLDRVPFPLVVSGK